MEWLQSAAGALRGFPPTKRPQGRVSA